MPEETEKWRNSIEIALAFLERSKPWSIAAKRSMDAVSKLYQAYKMQFTGQVQPVQPQNSDHTQNQLHMQPQQHFVSNPTNHSHVPGMEDAHAHAHTHAHTHFDYNGVPDVATLSMNPGVWSNDPNAMQHLSGFWDDMMWDTNLPDMLETPFGLGNEYEFQGAAQDSGAPCWMTGN
jgi:hypothetical protein